MTLKTVGNRIGFVVKHHHQQAADLALRLAEFVLSQGKEAKVRQVYFADESRPMVARLLKTPGIPKAKVKVVPKARLVDHCDLIVVLGGDGTFLSIARLMKNRSVPVLGVNMGQLGFLTEIKKSEAVYTLGAILEGEKPEISTRSLLEVTVKRKGKVVFQGPVVNDAVISKGAIARIIGIQVCINGKDVTRIRADGVIVSTPTGSTAYSLAAGGPILEPSLPALVITAICPHSLTQRPLVISDDATVEMCLQHRPGHVLLTLDGQDVVDLKEGDLVSIRKYKKHDLKIVSSPDRDYFGLLREKLKFGHRD
ncbi:MAG: NAD(+)/NADH kinase [Bdellovibrionales bacterium]|nr:NAD(+)/NADH kinase [Bdellovibrionales bacterium]